MQLRESVLKFETRKKDHLDLALDSAHQAFHCSGFESIRFYHEALPPLNFNELKLESKRFGEKVSTPFYISGMTAGHLAGVKINHILALAASQKGWAMGVGSQRRELYSKDSPDQWKKIRKLFPKLTFFANLGITQVIELVEKKQFEPIEKVVNYLQANALVIHTNPLQEVIQPEGTPHFKNNLSALEKIVKHFSSRKIPVVLKETGCGFSPLTLKRLRSIGLSALDVSGLGGTHWGRIEGARSGSDSIRARVAQTFANWGESTADSVRNAVSAFKKTDTEVWASGGVRSGLEAAKLLALGATQVGYAKPALEKALEGEESLLEWMELQEFELKTTLFCTGSKKIKNLSEKLQPNFVETSKSNTRFK